MNLYDFDAGNIIHYLTTAKAAVSVGGNQYLPWSLKRMSYSADTIQNKNNMKIIFPTDDPIMSIYTTPIRTPLLVTVRLMDGTIIFRGKLVTVSYNDQESTVDLDFQQSLNFDRTSMGERRFFQRTCPYSVYSLQCGADKAEHKVTVIRVVATDNIVVSYAGVGSPDEQFNAFPTGHDPTYKVNVGRFIGGLILAPDRLNQWWITNIPTNTLRVVGGTEITFNIYTFRPTTLEAGDEPFLLFGCKKSTSDCKDTHNNIARFGGFPAMTRQSPFSGGLRG